MDLSGTVIAILPSVTGESSKGAWIKHAFVIETQEQFSKKIHFTMFNKDPNSQLAFGEGDNVTVSFSVESREYNSRWYSDIKAYKVVTESQRGAQNKPSPPKPLAGAAATDDLWDTPSKPQASKQVDTSTDDLPF